SPNCSTAHRSDCSALASANCSDASAAKALSSSREAVVIDLPPVSANRRISPRRLVCRRRTTTLRRPPVEDPPRHSTDSGTEWHEMTWNRSYQIRFLGTSDPLGEPFTVLPLGDVVAHNTLHIVRQFGGGDLVPSQFTAESRIKPETAAEMDLETLDLLAFGVGDDLPLKTDVRGLYTRARIGTTVEVNADRVIEIVIEIGQSSLQFRDESFGPPLGLDNGEFAEFDARASHDTATPRCGSGVQTSVGEFGSQFVDLGLRNVEHDQLLLRRQAHAGGTGTLGGLGHRGEHRPGSPPGHRGRSHVVTTVPLAVDTHMVDGTFGRLGSRSVDQRPAEILRFQDLSEPLRTPVLDEELQPGAGT